MQFIFGYFLFIKVPLFDMMNKYVAEKQRKQAQGLRMIIVFSFF